MSKVTLAFIELVEMLRAGLSLFTFHQTPPVSLLTVALAGPEGELKMVFEILTDEEVEELKERAIRQRNFYAANLLRWEAEERSQPMAKPAQWPFLRFKDARVMLVGRCILERCELGRLVHTL